MIESLRVYHTYFAWFFLSYTNKELCISPFSTEKGVTRTTRIVFRKFQLYFIELLFSTWICKLTCLNVNHITYDVGRNDGLNFNRARGIYTLNLLSILPTNTAVSPGFFYETSLAARSEERRLYSQTLFAGYLFSTACIPGMNCRGYRRPNKIVDIVSCVIFTT